MDVEGTYLEPSEFLLRPAGLGIVEHGHCRSQWQDSWRASIQIGVERMSGILGCKLRIGKDDEAAERTVFQRRTAEHQSQCSTGQFLRDHNEFPQGVDHLVHEKGDAAAISEDPQLHKGLEGSIHAHLAHPVYTDSR